MRKALVVGINYYKNFAPLHGCVDDAHSVKTMLEHDSDGTPNFDVKPMMGTGPGSMVTRAGLRNAIGKLFEGDPEIALLYFAGHGHIETAGGFLDTSDAEVGDAGLALAEILTLANNSKARNRIIVLDSCHSGAAGERPLDQKCSEIGEGVTILSASTSEQSAEEDSEGGVFTKLFVDALNGGAANLVGEITPGSVYAYVDQSLGEWSQRPVFKTNVKKFVSLRRSQPPIELGALRQIKDLFPGSETEHPLDPSYEPTSANPDPVNKAKFAVLQAYNRVNLVVPVKAMHMYDAAMESKSCKLTVRGVHYRRLVVQKRI